MCPHGKVRADVLLCCEEKGDPRTAVFLVDGDDKANQLQELREKTFKKENLYLTFGIVPICSRQN